jgi:hypothetical protein
VSTMPNPLFGSWNPNSGTNVPFDPTSMQAPPGPAGTPGSTNPFGFGSYGGGALRGNIGEANLQTALQRNALIPQFAKMMFGAGGTAGDFFKQLTQLGSPFYQRKQQQTFEQGSKAAQDAAGQARQRITASGAGYTPSGVGAAAFGGEAQAEAGNQEEAFLNNLFQNEQLQALGASGLSQLAALFNPNQLATGQTEAGPPATSWTSDFANVFSSLFPKGWGGGK